MLNCGPNHHRLLVAVTAEPNGGHDGSAAGQHQHVMSVADDHHQSVSDGRANDLPSAHHLDKLTKVKCSACAACCMGAALPTAALAIAYVPPAMTMVSFVSTPHDDFLSDGLDRPPRLLLA